MRTGFPNLGTPLATSRETRPTQWLNFSRQMNTDKLSVLKSFLRRETLPEVCLEGNPPGNFSPQNFSLS
jgi:hypothetical protein